MEKETCSRKIFEELEDKLENELEAFPTLKSPKMVNESASKTVELVNQKNRLLQLAEEEARELNQELEKSQTELKRVTLEIISLKKEMDLPLTDREQQILCEDFYLRHLNLKFNFSKVELPAKKEGYNRLLFFPKNLPTYSISIVTKMREEGIHFSRLSTYAEVGYKLQHPRTTRENYAFRVKDTWVPDVKTLWESARKLEKKGFQGIAPLEWLIFDWMNYEETGKHLDVGCETLCIGARLFDTGEVPLVGYRPDDGILISFCSPKSKDYNRGIRSIVTTSYQPR